MSTRTLTIKSNVNPASSAQSTGGWSKMNNADSYIKDIDTGALSDDMSAFTLRALISGVPTPWARAKLFKFALESSNKNSGGLNQYYNVLRAEWKGLLAVMALYSDRISISDPISMDINDDDYSITAAFGRMLFDEKDLWCNQDDAANKDTQPFIQLIYYRKQLVGGTSPLTGCFTGVDYSQIPFNDISDIPWFHNGHFEDPDKHLKPDEIQKVYLFVSNLRKNAEDFEKKVNTKRNKSTKVDLQGFKDSLNTWKEALQQGHKVYEQGPVAQYPEMTGPFALLFDFKLPVYMKPGSIFTYQKPDGTFETVDDIQNLLSTDDYVLGWFEKSDTIQKLADKSPVRFLTCHDPKNNRTCYFSLPLSELGLATFLNNLGTLTSAEPDKYPHLSAEYNGETKQIAVSLCVEVDGQKVTLPKREYKIHEMYNNLGSVILWPNFYSENWNRYYLYSGFTTNADENFIPIFRDIAQNNIIRNCRNKFYTFPLEADEEDKTKVTREQLVTYQPNCGEDKPKYNIDRYDKPIIGLMAQTRNDRGRLVGAGYMIIRKDKENKVDANSLQEAVVGIDFGSHNTCVYYKKAGETNANAVKFDNYRAVLIGEEETNPQATALNDELLFFHSYVSNDGQLKSWLHEHPIEFLKAELGANTVRQGEICDGIPVNRPNVMVKDMDDYSITTQAGKLHYKMKWLNDDAGHTKKRAYIQNVWIQICAYLFKEKHLQPQSIYWSYPGAMLPSEISSLESIFNACNSIMPIKHVQVSVKNRITEAVAECRYSLTDSAVHSQNMLVGIDVGGSTSDFHLIASDPENRNEPSLFMESSVRMAAGAFHKTAVKSAAFRKALHDFDITHDYVFVNGIGNIENKPKMAPYCLNSIYDQLKTPEQHNDFYLYMSDNAKVVFTIPAYVTGLLLFYSGMMIGKTIRDHDLQNINSVNVLTFGNGGRIFHWLPVVNESDAKKYYTQCLNAGLQEVIDKELTVDIVQNTKNSKAAVAIGLCKMDDTDRAITKKFIGKSKAELKKELKKSYDDFFNSDSKPVKQPEPEIKEPVDKDICPDICGENGITFTDENGKILYLKPADELTPKMFENINNFDFKELKCFNKFFTIFSKFIKDTNLYKKDDLRQGLNELHNRMRQFIENDAEYIHAKKLAKTENATLAYHQPLLIAEGVCFLEQTLIQKIFNE